MICKGCGTLNDYKNSFCTACGDEIKPDSNTCPICLSENDNNSKFCIQCGNTIQRREKQLNNPVVKQNHKKHSKKNTQNKFRTLYKKTGYTNDKSLKMLWISVGVVIITVLSVTSLDLIFHKYPEKIPVEVKSNNPAIESKVTEIASKFICSCGTCNEKSLEICTCPTAIEERSIIRKALEQNKSNKEIIYLVANKYGWLKTQFASQYEVDESKIWDPAKRQIQSAASDLVINSGKKAINIDKELIYSVFNCPCGQCVLDELKDCNCSHPNGAKEIKNFIGEKIAESKLTVNEIIDMVNKKYGGRKI